MLYKYNKLVLDYINGEEMDNIDELENDYKFMMEVINVSRDKKIYNLCSSDVKNNYEFVRFVIDTFKNDKDFIEEVANNYMNSVSSDDITYKELIFILAEIFNDRDDDKCMFYRLKRLSIYTNERMANEYLIDNEKDLSMKQRFGMGFVIILNGDLGNSEVITRYFANGYLNSIFYDNDISLEELIHGEFYDNKKLQLVGIKNFILDYVRKYDVALSDYLFVHMDLINNLEKDITKIINRWDYYMERNMERKNLIFEQEVNNIMMDYDVHFDYFSVCAYIDRLKLNIHGKLSYDGYEDLYPIEIIDLGLKEYACLKKIIELAKDLFGTSIIDTEYEYKKNDSNVKKKEKIINFKNNDNK